MLQFEELADGQLFLQKKDDLIKPKVMRPDARAEFETTNRGGATQPVARH
jgi:hypothetical protein